MNGIIGASVFLLVALILVYYWIEVMVVDKWSKEAWKENLSRLLLIITLFVFAIVFYLGRKPGY